MRFVIDASSHPRQSPLIRVSPEQGRGGQHPTALRDEATGEVVAVQHDEGTGELSFVVPGQLAAGETRTLTATDEPVTAAHPTTAVVKLDRVVLKVGGERFADYIVAGGRRPYFWPVVSATGSSVVRGQGSSDHPHHTGLAISYGGHSEDGSTNIWSDWDEPPYGPGGRMVHRGFR
ncbi:MAG TPA: DUF6807 family protein, partial [Bacillota bacterium]|nr:DUF6807 family protein [Bacillota bacterium]